MNFYAFLADFVVFIHLLYMGYILFGQLGIMIGWPCGWRWIRNPWFRLTHLTMILIVVAEASVGMMCPLTTWEADLRRAAGQDGGVEGASFTGRLLHSIQFAGAEYWPEYINTSFYVAGALIAATAILVPPRFRRPQPVLAPEPAPAIASVTAITATPPK